MAVRIRLKRTGRRNRAHFRIGVYDATTRRDGEPIESLGSYHPEREDFDERLDVDEERLDHWIGNGAKPTDNLQSILEKAEIL